MTSCGIKSREFAVMLLISNAATVLGKECGIQFRRYVVVQMINNAKTV